MISYNEYFRPVGNVSKLGYTDTSDNRIPLEYLDNRQFVLFRTCHSYGDWVLLSAIPRLLKQKYPDCTVVIPSPDCLAKYFSPDAWHHKHTDPFKNVVEIFKNNPYVDGMIDSIPNGLAIYHDHFRIYNDVNPNIPIAEQMLKYWRFDDNELLDSQPELYWDVDEIEQGNQLINKYFGNDEYGFLYIDDVFFIETQNELREPLKLKRERIQAEINKHTNAWIYYYNDRIEPMPYKFNSLAVNVNELNCSLRVQNYIKSKSKLVIGHQGGYGTDCMPRYTDCFVVPIAYNHINEHIVRNSTYMSCYDYSETTKI